MPVVRAAPVAEPTPVILVEHDVQVYRFADLARGLTPKELRAIEAASRQEQRNKLGMRQSDAGLRLPQRLRPGVRVVPQDVV